MGTRLNKGESALLPSGRDLSDARKAAIRALPDLDGARYQGEGVYERAKTLIQSKNRWLEVAKFSVLNKLCRGLVSACVFSVVGAGILLLFHEELKNGTFGIAVASLPIPVVVAIIPFGIILSAALFKGFVDFKWEHMINVYRLAVAIHSKDSNRRSES